MRHYVVVFLESRLFPGTWVTDHFVRKEEREDVADLPPLSSSTHIQALRLLKEWQNEAAPNPAWTLEECLLGGMACLTVLWYGNQETTPKRMIVYHLEPFL